MAIFKGAGVAIVTPMKDNFEINYEQLEENINYQIDNGTDCIVITGTTGESSTLTEKEHLDAIKAAVGFAKHRVPVVAGTGSNCTKTAINMSKEADSYGVDGLLIVTPYYNKATQGGLVSHYTQIAREVKAPIIMYNVPSRTGCNLMPATVAELVKNVDNIVGIKDATGNLSQAAQMMNLCDGNLELYSGNDDQVLPLLSLGGLGVISVLSNIAPRQTHDMVMEYLEGDRNKAMKIQLDAIPLMLGMGAGPLRAPLSEMTDANKERLAAEMKKFGLM